jgi:hypothetical protein
VRGIDRTLVDEVWSETTSYPPGRIDEEAREFLARQPDVAAFAHTLTHEQDPAIQRAALGLCFLLFKVLERSLGQPFPQLSESRLRAAHEAATEWVRQLGDEEPARALEGIPGHATLAAYMISVFYGADGAGCDDRVRTSLALMLRILTDALDLGPIEA